VSRTPGVISRDLAAFAGFGAVALPGVLPLPVLVFFPIALGLSLFDIRPLAGRRTVSVLVLLVLALGLFGAVATSLLDLVIAAVSFATLVTCHRMLAEPTPQASRQVLLSGLLLVSGGAALTGEVLFAVLLVAYFLCATWSMAWLVLAADEASVDPAERRAISRQLIVGSVATLVMGLAFFVAFPRLSWNLANRRAPPGLGGVTGMSETVRLGGGGDIKTSARVAFRVALLPDPGSDRIEAYWVGRHFDLFDGAEWRSTGIPATPASAVGLHRASQRSGTPVSQEFETTAGYGSRTLVALDTPTFFARARSLSVSGTQPMPLIHVPGDQVFGAIDANAMNYTATSDELGRVDRTPPNEVDALAVPAIDPRIAPLAKEFTGGATKPTEIALKLERELKRRYAYTLELPGAVSDPLGDFLFNRRAGHCEDFATALAIMLRVEKVPSRVVTGFFGGERAGGRYVVRSGDAHAWTEAFIDGAWMRLDATPELGRAASSNAWVAALTGAWERLEAWWRTRVMDYSFQDQISFARQLVRPAQVTAPTPETGAWSPLNTRVPFGAVALVCVGVGLLVFLLQRGRRRAPHPASSFLEELEGRLKARGVTAVTTVPLEELSASLLREGHPLAPAVARATRRYLEARFTNRPLDVRERRALLAPLETSNG
jgi:protein-glutamine gamma-glutamyltransferase